MPNLATRAVRAFYRSNRVHIYEKDLCQPIADPDALIEVVWREGTLDDVERLTSAEHNYDETRKRYAHEALQEGATFLLAEYEGRIAHLCWTGYRDVVLPGLDIPLGPSRAFMFDARTPEEFRSKRLHNAGIRERLRRLKAAGKSHAIGMADAGNPTSIKNFEREGFQLLGTVKMVRLFRKFRFVQLSQEARDRISS